MFYYIIIYIIELKLRKRVLVEIIKIIMWEKLVLYDLILFSVRVKKL